MNHTGCESLPGVYLVKVAAARVADKARPGNMVGGVAGCVVGAEQIVGNTYRQGRDGDAFEFIPRQRGNNGRFVDQPADVLPAVAWALETARREMKPVVVNVHVEEHASPDGTTSFGGYN